MKQIRQWLMIAGVAGAACLGAGQALAQDNTAAGADTANGGNRGGRQGRGNFDPAQMRERMMERYRDALEIKDDTEWKAIEPLVTKVMEARLSGMGGMGRGMFGRPPGGDNNGGGDRANRRGFPGQEPNPAAEALQKAIDAKASNAELKAALAKYQDSRKAKQAELEKAQAELKKVLSLRQEAIAELNGLL